MARGHYATGLLAGSDERLTVRNAGIWPVWLELRAKYSHITIASNTRFQLDFVDRPDACVLFLQIANNHHNLTLDLNLVSFHVDR